MFDKDGKGYISLSDLQSILYSAFSMGPSEVEVLFKKVDTKNDGLITFGKLYFYINLILTNIYNEQSSTKKKMNSNLMLKKNQVS